MPSKHNQAAPFHTPTNSAKTFLLPHTLSSIYYLLIFFYDGHSDWYEVIPHYKFDLHFSNEWSEKAMAPHSSTLAWKIPWTEQPGRLQSMGSLRVGHDWATSRSRIGEGNGNPLQYSCLENPRDGEAWWAAVYGVAQSRTRLK